jgi:hypothetical protein
VGKKGGGVATKDEPSPAETAIQPGNQFGPSEAKVQYSSDASRAEVHRAAKQIFGRDMSDQDLASLVGAPKDATVRVRKGWGDGDSASITLQTDHPGIVGQERTLYRRGNDVVIHNDYFRTKNQGGGLGSEVIGRQMEQAQRLGVTKIETQAARWDSSDPKDAMIGYKVWPKMGYDGPLPMASRQKLATSSLPPAQRSATKISELYKTKEGRDWWEKHGQSIDVSFDMRPGSYSRRAMSAYQAAKKKGR